MRKIELDQKSDEWLEWRRSVVTATDAPALLGISPYQTPYQCWQRKLQQIPEQEMNPAMLRGVADEPIARLAFVQKYGINFVPACIESDKYPFLGASLDGISDCGRYIVEIKSNGQKTHGTVPDHHFAQVQHQLLCTDGTAEKAYYVSYLAGNIHVTEIYPDEVFQRNYVKKASDFWSNIMFFDAPELTDKDYLDMSLNDEWKSLSDQYIEVSRTIKYFENDLAEIKQKMLSCCDNKSAKGCGIKLLNRLVRGRVDYDAIPELRDVDLEKYMKNTSKTCSIYIDKEKK